MAGPKMDSLNYVINFIKDVIINDIVYNLEDLFDIRVTCGDIIRDGDQLYLLDSILNVLNDNYNNIIINNINYILNVTLYCTTYNIERRFFSIKNNKITY